MSLVPSADPVTSDRGAASGRRGRLRRALVGVGVIALAWSAAIAITGGLLFQLGGMRISSRNPLNPLILAAIALGAACLLAPAGRRLHAIATEILDTIVPAPLAHAARRLLEVGTRLLAVLPGSPSVPAVAAVVLAVGMSVHGITGGTLVAAGADAYGYASYGHLWAAGTLHVEPPWMDEIAQIVPGAAVVPLGYRIAPDGTSMVPTYSPGLPMVMGLLERLTGRREAVFFAAPLLAGLGIWATYLLGRRIGGPAIGLTAAVLMASNPLFLHYLVHPPMSDLSAMAWWTLALALVAAPSRSAAFVAGLAAGAAILTRPNLVPLALVPGLLLVWQAFRAQRVFGVDGQRALAFAAGSTPACLMLAWLNNHWYGSPLMSGYGSLRSYFSLDYLPANLVNYSLWTLETTPIFGLAAALALLVRPPLPPQSRHARPLMLACGGFAVLILLLYLCYLVFDGWWALRFLVPAFPGLLVLTCVVIAGVRLQLSPGLRGVAWLLVGASIIHGLTFTQARSGRGHTHEHRYRLAGVYAAQQLPERAVIVSMIHSGTARYYSDRPTLRYDFIDPAGLEPALAELRERGYQPYFMLDEREIDVFRERFADATPFGQLDWAPVIIQPGGVRIYDPQRRQTTPAS